ncbi:MAG TPA: ATP-binding protein [Vicinamibacterales bacterium]|nr:ATP-binding protein [Vicinamibacterales bacterium]
MRILEAQPLRRQVIVATCGLLIPFALAAIWSANRTRVEREEEVEQQAESVAHTSAAYLNEYLSGLDSMASALTRHPAVMTLDRASSDRLFADVLSGQPLLLNIVLTDRNAVVKGTGLPVRVELGPKALSYVQAVLSSGKALISELTTGQVSGKPTVVLAYPVRQEGRSDVVGVLALGINLTEMQTLFRDIPLPEGSVVTLTDAKSRVLARSRDADLYIGKALGTTALPKDVPGRRVMTGPDGVPRFYGNAVIGRGPWLLSVGIPTSVAVSRLAPLFLRNIIISSVGIVAVLLLSLGLSTLIGRGISGVRDAVQRIADGDLSPPVRTPVPNLELAQLQNAFITMAANLRETQEKLDRQFEQERKVRETLQSLQRQVVRQERLAAVGVLVSGVAHELNNPLQAILGTAELLERRGGLSDDALEEIAFVKTQAGRAREIIRNLSRFSSQQSGPPALVDLRDVIGEVVQLRRRDLDAGTIALDIETSTTRTVYANFTELEQVMLNFVINAQQSIEAVGRTKGRILIRLFDVGKRVRLEVHDDGPGVTPEDEPKLFQPFFTTKPVGKGTGLGLSVSYGIIESYGGSIGHQGNQWGGATFYFELPASDPARLAPPGDTSAQTNDRSSLLPRSVPTNV